MDRVAAGKGTYESGSSGQFRLSNRDGFTWRELPILGPSSNQIGCTGGAPLALAIWGAGGEATFYDE